MVRVARAPDCLGLGAEGCGLGRQLRGLQDFALLSPLFLPLSPQPCSSCYPALHLPLLSPQPCSKPPLIPLRHCGTLRAMQQAKPDEVNQIADFEKSLDELEKLVAKMEAGDQSLDD